MRAAGVDRGVWHVMTGLPYAGRLAFGRRRPVLGHDVAGTVVAGGAVVPSLDRVPARAAADAIADLVAGGVRGKVANTV